MLAEQREQLTHKVAQNAQISLYETKSMNKLRQVTTNLLTVDHGGFLSNFFLSRLYNVCLSQLISHVTLSNYELYKGQSRVLLFVSFCSFKFCLKKKNPIIYTVVTSPNWLLHIQMVHDCSFAASERQWNKQLM